MKKLLRHDVIADLYNPNGSQRKTHCCRGSTVCCPLPSSHTCLDSKDEKILYVGVIGYATQYQFREGSPLRQKAPNPSRAWFIISHGWSPIHEGHHLSNTNSYCEIPPALLELIFYISGFAPLVSANEDFSKERNFRPYRRAGWSSRVVMFASCT